MKKAIGIDIGGTKINIGVIDEEGIIIDRIRLDTERNKGRDHILNKLKKAIGELTAKFHIDAVGIGTPGFINVDTGTVTFSGETIANWGGTNIKEEIENVFSIPVIVDNDANVAAIGEGWLGSAKDFNSFIMITLGTGVGGAFYTEKSGIIRGQNWQAGELGHMILYPNGIKCNCGQNGCAEQYLSGTAIERLYKEKYKESLIGKEIFEKAHNGDEKCKSIVNDFINNFAIYLVSLKNLFDPEVVVIGGGVIGSKEYWLDSVEEQFRKRLNSKTYFSIIPANLSNDAGMYGAAKLALQLNE
ncbi:ROK family protein [Brassicibacter mesophilus]|uniref:ROK family protein n=1 Tax=Brassicibacter mesophilus TaxID=745119 RepID=UPI003D1CB749